MAVSCWNVMQPLTMQLTLMIIYGNLLYLLFLMTDKMIKIFTILI